MCKMAEFKCAYFLNWTKGENEGKETERAEVGTETLCPWSTEN